MSIYLRLDMLNLKDLAYLNDAKINARAIGNYLDHSNTGFESSVPIISSVNSAVW